MAAVAAGRKDDWLALFAPDAIVQDPVGPWLGDSGATITVDCVVIYTVDEDGLITSIRAHWEPERAMATLTRP
jgi:hypothetical protein